MFVCFQTLNMWSRVFGHLCHNSTIELAECILWFQRWLCAASWPIDPSNLLVVASQLPLTCGHVEQESVMSFGCQSLPRPSLNAKCRVCEDMQVARCLCNFPAAPFLKAGSSEWQGATLRFCQIWSEIKSTGSFGWPGDPCYCVWAKVRGRLDELASLSVANSREGYWGCFGSRGLLFICKLFRKWCVSVFVLCGTHGIVSSRCSHDLFDLTIRPQRLVPQFAPRLKCVRKSLRFCFRPWPSQCTFSPTRALNVNALCMAPTIHPFYCATIFGVKNCVKLSIELHNCLFDYVVFNITRWRPPILFKKSSGLQSKALNDLL